MNTFRHVLVTPAHTTSYLEAGPEDGPLLVFVHGWPGLGSTWHYQLGQFAARGYRVVAPDMRGYGDSTVHDDPAAYRQELVVADMLALLDHLGRGRAVWIGHDWGSPTVWNIAAHFPERCVAAATLAIAFGTLERGCDGLLAVVDRARYPEDTSPYGQFDYMAFYESHAKHAASVFEAAPGNTVKAVFGRGDPAVHTRPAPRSEITRDGGWFGGARSAPDAPLSSTVLTERDFEELTGALTRNGFGGPTGYYLNNEVNARYADAAPGGRVLRLPVLFVGAAYDQVADLCSPTALDAMRSTCPDLTEDTVPAVTPAAGALGVRFRRWAACCFSLGRAVNESLSDLGGRVSRPPRPETSSPGARYDRRALMAAPLPAVPNHTARHAEPGMGRHQRPGGRRRSSEVPGADGAADSREA